jgi:uncharacterized membrane protein YhhN
MNSVAFLLLALTAVAAVADWIAVSRGTRGAEFLLKPLVMVGLIAVALALEPSSGFARAMIVAGLVLSMIGDVFLMLPKDRFVAGLAAFLVAHVFYIVGLIALGISVGGFVVGALVMIMVTLFVSRRVIAGAASTDRALIGPVTAYVAVLSFMVATAFGIMSVFAIIGAVLFGASDSILGWTRFVSDFPRSRTIVMVTYHLGQAGLVLALI